MWKGRGDISWFTLSFCDAIRHCNKTLAKILKGVYNIKVTLNKSKNKCVYNEKIYQGDTHQTLVCEFDSSQLENMANLMNAFYKAYPTQIAKNNIFEAKMSSNRDILKHYLMNPKYCKVIQSERKLIF